MRYVAVLLLVAVFALPAVTAEPDLPEPVFLVELPGEPVLPTPVSFDHPRPAPVEHAAQYQAIDRLYLGLGWYEEPHALAAARDEYEPPKVWMPRVFSPPPDFGWTVEYWRPKVEAYPWPVEEALAIIRCESGGNPDAISRTNDWGLFQHHYTFWKGRSEQAGYPNTSPLDPDVNIAVAFWLWNSKGGSWQDWTCAAIVGVS